MYCTTAAFSAFWSDSAIESILQGITVSLNPLQAGCFHGFIRMVCPEQLQLEYILARSLTLGDRSWRPNFPTSSPVSFGPSTPVQSASAAPAGLQSSPGGMSDVGSIFFFPGWLHGSMSP